MNPWLETRRDVIEAVERGATQVSEFEAGDSGPVTFDAMSFPYVEVLPEAMDYQGGNDWQHSLRLNMYFQRGRSTDYLDLLAVAMEALQNALGELAGVESVRSYYPQTIEDYSGEPNDTLLILISVQLAVGTSIDLAEHT